MEKEIIKITIENRGEKMELTIDKDSNLENWEHTFRVILKWITFSESLIDKFFGRDECGEELKEE